MQPLRLRCLNIVALSTFLSPVQGRKRSMRKFAGTTSFIRVAPSLHANSHAYGIDFSGNFKCVESFVKSSIKNVTTRIFFARLRSVGLAC